MSVYANAAMQGMNAIHVMGGGDNAGTIAAYNEAYSAQQAFYAASDAKNTAEANISAINQDKILTNVQIEMNQQEAEAQLAVNAAAAGVSGGSVDAVAYGIDANVSMQKQQAEAQADQLTEQQLANVSAASASMSSAQAAVPKTATVTDSLLQTAGSMSSSDWETAEAFLSSDDGISSLWSS